VGVQADAEPASRLMINTDSRMTITAVCISRYKEVWSLQNVPFYNYTEGWKPFQHEQTRERVAYLAGRRNTAVERALSMFPQTKHILMIDSYYLAQARQITDLIREYLETTHSQYPSGCILGASAWILDKTRIRSRVRFYDGWTTPEGLRLRPREAEVVGGFIRANAVGGCYVYPKWVWEKIRYNVPDDLHGCEHNWLCEHSGLPVFLSLNQMLWRDALVYGWPKRMRVSLHLGRLIGKQSAR
jgi:hypothetical protein